MEQGKETIEELMDSSIEKPGEIKFQLNEHKKLVATTSDQLPRLVSQFMRDVQCYRDLEQADTIVMQDTGDVLETYRKAGIVALVFGLKVVVEDAIVSGRTEVVTCWDLVRFMSDQNHRHVPPEYD